MTCALRVRRSTAELRRHGQKNCIRPATFRVIASGVLHRMVQGEAKQSRVVYDCFGPSGLAMTEVEFPASFVAALLAMTEKRLRQGRVFHAPKRHTKFRMKLSGVPKNWDRRTSIIAPVGPATTEATTIRHVTDAGVDVVRLNFAHEQPDEHARRYEAVRTSERESGRTVAVLQDLAGHEIRVGRLRDGALELRQGQPLVITADEVVGSNGTISTSYPGLPRNVRAGDRILLDDGTLKLIASSTAAAAVTSRCVRGGILREHKGINLPGISVDLPAMTDKDVKDLAFGVRLGVDYIALSFVQRAKDVSLARQAITERGGQIPLIAKLEKAEAINALDEIIKEADGVMVARGDLGVDLDPEWVPVLQKTILQKANAAGIPVIIAPQMLVSMVHSPRPTRAETSAADTAILDGTDAVMLSAETAVGEYPVEAVTMMDRIARAAESSTPSMFGARGPAERSTTISMAHAAATIAHEVRARAIVVMTRSGVTGQLLSKLRPHSPVVEVTAQETAARRLVVWWVGEWRDATLKEK